MKTFCKYIFLCACLGFSSCMQYDQFERIEDNKLRVIAVRYEPTAEIVPGDTLTGKVYFAGNNVISVNDFSIAYIRKWDQNYYFPDERKIELIDSISWLPDSMQFRYRIPEDVFVKEKSFGDVDTNKIKSVVDLIRKNRDAGDTLLEQLPKDSLTALFDIVNTLSSQCFLFFHARSENGSDLKVSSNFYIRYNSLFPKLMPINHNPLIKWLGVYKVENQYSQNFSPDNANVSGKFSLTYLYNEYSPEKVNDTIEIDDKYTYFLAGDRGINTYVNSTGDTIHDTTCDIITINSPDTSYSEPEIYSYNWFYQNTDNVTDKQDSLVSMESWGVGPSLVRLTPPVFTNMKHFKVWLVIHDSFPKQWNRPVGYTLRAVNGVFKYTEAYENKHKQ